MPRFGLIFAIAALLAMSAVGSAGAASLGLSAPAAGTSAQVSGAAVSGLTPARRAAKRRALKNCRKVRKKVKRKACLKRVQQRFKVKPVRPPVQGPIGATIDVRDKYFSPDMVDIRRGESILWVWPLVNKDAHNVELVNAPAGVNKSHMSTPNSPSRDFEFRRTFTVPGTYSFVCSIHHLMTMTVEVSK